MICFGSSPTVGSSSIMISGYPRIACANPTRCRFFGLFGRGEDYYIPWDCVQRFGEDIILIDKPAQHRDPALERRRRKKF